MPWVTRHLRVGLILVLLVLCSCLPLTAGAATALPLLTAAQPKVIITELQTAADSASQEFVELYNTTDSDIAFPVIASTTQDVWKLQFFSSSATANGTPDWTLPATTVTLNGTIHAHDYFLLAATGYAPDGMMADQEYSSRMANTGGGLQLVSVSATAQTYNDRLMWKQPVSGQSLPDNVWPTPAAKGSLQRMPNDDSEYVDADGTSSDFTASGTITPNDVWLAPAPPEPVIPDPSDQGTIDTPLTSDGGTTTDNPSPEGGVIQTPPTTIDNTGLAIPYITELLPNPAAPLTDGNDEFIELYNPNEATFNLAGYTLEVGTTTLHDFTFAAGTTLAAQAYTAFYSRDTKLSMTNSGGQARLLDATKNKVSETLLYDAADDGMSWSLSNSSWQWSTTETPDAANLITAPVVPAKAVTTKATTSTAAKKAATAKTASAKTTSAKVKGTSTTKTKKAAKPKAKKATKTKLSTAAQITAEPERAPIHSGILVTVVALAVLYAAYEYRHDIQNRLHRLRRNRATRAYARQ